MEAQLIPEIDVLIKVAKWLHSHGWQLEKISMPHGQGVNTGNNRNELLAEFNTIGISTENLKFAPEGEDIRARQGNNLWRIECKGLSSGKLTTVKNNFDRAVASAVSYYTRSDGLRLGIALPEWYKKFFPSKLPKALRLAINLWVFLYCGEDEIYEFAPHEEIPE